MIFPQKKLAKSHSDAYRQVQIPRPISAIWISAGIEYVNIEYSEARDEVIVRPVRNASGT